MATVAFARVALVFGGILYQMTYGVKPQIMGGPSYSTYIMGGNSNLNQSTLTQSFSTKLHQDDYIDLFL